MSGMGKFCARQSGYKTHLRINHIVQLPIWFNTQQGNLFLQKLQMIFNKPIFGKAQPQWP